MKVVKPGRSQSGRSREAKCTGKGNGDGGCGAVLLVEEPDLFRTFTHARDETDTYTTFRCVQCGVETDIDVPGNVERTLPTKAEWLRTHAEGASK